MRVFATVGMSPWPFDRFVEAIAPLCSDNEVFVQTGASRLQPPCPSAPYLPYPELMARMASADVVVTHAGNTVRLVQRLGKVPIAVARTALHREMPNDHQVEYLRHEERAGRVVAVWRLEGLAKAVRGHRDVEGRLLRERPLPPLADGDEVAQRLDELWSRVAVNPFRKHHPRRHAYAWERLSGREGRHLDVGVGSGEFLQKLASTTRLDCAGVEPHPDALAEFRRTAPEIPVAHVGIHGPLPFPEGHFESVSLLDVLEHCPDDDALLGEIRRVLAPGGLLVITVPRRHAFSWLDPDGVKFRRPRLHRLVYSARFGAEIYRRRFADLSDGLFGDISLGRTEHTNYRAADLLSLLHGNGFAVRDLSGANLFWRPLQIPSLLAGRRVRALLERAIALDDRLFSRANLFVSAERLP